MITKPDPITKSFFVTHKKSNGLLDREPMDSVQSFGVATIFLRLRFRFIQRHNAGHCPRDMKPMTMDLAVQFFPGALFATVAGPNPLINAMGGFLAPPSKACLFAVENMT